MTTQFDNSKQWRPSPGIPNAFEPVAIDDVEPAPVAQDEDSLIAACETSLTRLQEHVRSDGQLPKWTGPKLVDESRSHFDSDPREQQRYAEMFSHLEALFVLPFTGTPEQNT